MSPFTRRLFLGAVGMTAAATVLPSRTAEAKPTSCKAYNPNARSRCGDLPRYSDAPRDAFAWPFARTSIWNMPLGTKARYVPLNMTAPAQGYAPDETYLVFDDTAPLRRLIERDTWWPWPGGSEVVGVDSGIRVHTPDGWILAPPDPDNYPNRMTAMIQADGAVREFQYTVRPTATSDISFHDEPRAVYDLTGDGLTGPNGFGAHGGSGMTAIGGTLRAGDLVGDRPIRHALSFTADMRKWGTAEGGGYRWPAIARDAYGADDDGYGSLPPHTGRLQMGSLVALPCDLDLDRLDLGTVAGRKIADALQGWGAYVVDDSYNPGEWDVHMIGADEDAMAECPDLLNSWGDLQTPLRADLDKLMPHLALIANNTARTIGGGGKPIRPLAPPFVQSP